MSLLMDALRRAEEEKRRAEARLLERQESMEVRSASGLGETGTEPLPKTSSVRLSESESGSALSLEPLSPPAETTSTYTGREDFPPALPLAFEHELEAAPLILGEGREAASGEIDGDGTQESLRAGAIDNDATRPTDQALKSSLREFFDASQSLNLSRSQATDRLDESLREVLRRDQSSGPKRMPPLEASAQAQDFRSGASQRVSAQAVLTAAKRGSSARLLQFLFAGLFVVTAGLGALAFYWMNTSLAPPRDMPSPRVAANLERLPPPKTPAAQSAPALAPALTPPTSTATAAEATPATSPDSVAVDPGSSGAGSRSGASSRSGFSPTTDVAAATTPASAVADSDSSGASSRSDANSSSGANSRSGVSPTAEATSAPTPTVASPINDSTPATSPVTAAADASPTTAGPSASAEIEPDSKPETAPAPADTLLDSPSPATLVATTPPPSKPKPLPERVPVPAEAPTIRADASAPVLMAEDGVAPIASAVRISRSRQDAKLAPELVTAYAAWRKGELATAESLYRQILARKPRQRDALLGLAAIRLKRGDVAGAESLYRDVLREYPQDSLATAALFNLRAGDAAVVDAARLKLMLDAEPAAGHVHFALGNRYASEQRWREAQAAYFEAVRLDVDNPDYIYNLGIALDKIGSRIAAADQYRRALTLAARRPGSFPRAEVESRLRWLEAHPKP